ncbi:UPF1 [Symbiodinium sp. CCMP2592]|nr:UPF1 [Symbiodinium sp. CCMP2592]
MASSRSCSADAGACALRRGRLGLVAPLHSVWQRGSKKPPQHRGTGVFEEASALARWILVLGTSQLSLCRRRRCTRSSRVCSTLTRRVARGKEDKGRLLARDPPEISDSSLYCPICKVQCTSTAMLAQHVAGKRHKKMLKRTGLPDIYVPEAYIGKSAAKSNQKMKNQKQWRRLVSKRDLSALLATVRSDRQVSAVGDLLLVAAAVGGAQEFAEVLDLVVERNSRINVATYHQVLTELLFRVPTPVAMVRLALNLTIRKPDDIVPLLPDGLGDGPSEVELFRGCCPRGEVADGSGSIESTCDVLQGVVIEDLLARVELPDFAAGFVDYYSHFIPILHLDFLEELMQKQRTWEKPQSFLVESGNAALQLQPEPSDDGKVLVLRKTSTSLARGSKIDVSPGNSFVLSKAGVSVIHGGAICFAQTVYFASAVSSDAETGLSDAEFALALDVGGKDKVRQICRQEELVDVYSAINIPAYQRQLAALGEIAQRAQTKRLPLWELLPLSGVGGDIVDSWATKMRSKLQKAKAEGRVGTRSLPNAENDVNILKLKSLAEEDLSPSGMRLEPSAELNASQREAAVAALQRRLTVIQGPPGTGKTHVSVEILRLWSRAGVRPILVSSHNNVAVDNIAESAYAKGLDVVRLAKPSRISSALDRCSLDSILQETCGDYMDGSERYDATRRILKQADVVCVTTIASATALLKRLQFGAILMDEAAQTTELSALVPLAHLRADRLVLVGDHCQLPAAALSLEAETRGLTLSLFQRLVLRGFPSFFLDTQFRMHPSIAEHSSDAFYDAKLLSGVSAAMRPPPAGFEWPCSTEGIAVIDTGRDNDCSEERNGQSWCNPGEAVLLTQILSSVLDAGELQASQIGVVTPYMGQVRTLRRLIRKYLRLSPEASKELLVASVDSFQGREKELILFSSVRCNRGGSVGFLADWRRLNVMLTRARRGLIIVGNYWTLRADPYWRAYVDWAKKRGYALDFNLPQAA